MSEQIPKPKRRQDSLEICVTSTDPAEQDRQVAAAMLRPSVRGGTTIANWGTAPFDVGVTELVAELSNQGAAAVKGDLSRLEGMLAVQAHTLDAMFNNYAQLARKNLGQHLAASEIFMRLSLKAQAQCRATIETLAEIKYPKSVAFVKQANIAQGHQQVNNGEASDARGNQFSANEVLESAHEQLEHSTAATAGFGYSKMAAVGAIDGATKQQGEGAVEPEQLQARGKVA